MTNAPTRANTRRHAPALEKWAIRLYNVGTGTGAGGGRAQRAQAQECHRRGRARSGPPCTGRDKCAKRSCYRSTQSFWGGGAGLLAFSISAMMSSKMASGEGVRVESEGRGEGEGEGEGEGKGTATGQGQSNTIRPARREAAMLRSPTLPNVLMFWLTLADASRKAHFHSNASFWPTSVGTCLGGEARSEGSAPQSSCPGASVSAVCVYAPLLLQVALVADEDDRDPVGAGRVQDLVADDLAVLERVLGGDRVHEHVPVDPDGVLGVEDGVLVLACTLLGPRLAQGVRVDVRMRTQHAHGRPCR